MILPVLAAPAAPAAPAPANAAAAAAIFYCLFVLSRLNAINVALSRGFYCTSTYAYVSYRIYFYLGLHIISYGTLRYHTSINLRCHVVSIVRYLHSILYGTYVVTVLHFVGTYGTIPTIPTRNKPRTLRITCGVHATLWCHCWVGAGR